MVKNPPPSAGDKGLDFLIWKDPTYCGATNPVRCKVEPVLQSLGAAPMETCMP